MCQLHWHGCEREACSVAGHAALRPWLQRRFGTIVVAVVCAEQRAAGQWHCITPSTGSIRQAVHSFSPLTAGGTDVGECRCWGFDPQPHLVVTGERVDGLVCIQGVPSLVLPVR